MKRINLKESLFTSADPVSAPAGPASGAGESASRRRRSVSALFRRALSLLTVLVLLAGILAVPALADWRDDLWQAFGGEPAEEDSADNAQAVEEEDLPDPDGTYTTRDDVAAYINAYGCLPQNFITKKEAKALGWPGGSLEPYAPGKCIGGDRYGNYEGLLPKAKGRTYTECDINTLGKKSRGAERIVFSNDGLIYYTSDHYETFELLYGEE